MARVWSRTERGPIQGKHQEGTNGLGKPGSAGRSPRAEGLYEVETQGGQDRS